MSRTTTKGKVRQPPPLHPSLNAFPANAGSEHLEAAASAINDLSAQDVALTQLALMSELECPPWEPDHQLDAVGHNHSAGT